MYRESMIFDGNIWKIKYETEILSGSDQSYKLLSNFYRTWHPQSIIIFI